MEQFVHFVTDLKSNSDESVYSFDSDCKIEILKRSNSGAGKGHKKETEGITIPSQSSFSVQDITMSSKYEIKEEMAKKLLLGGQRICIVDWTHQSLPKDIPDIFDEKKRKKLENILSLISDEKDNEARGVHSLGLLPLFMKMKGSEDCNEYQEYKKVPAVSFPHACACSNKYQHIYTKDGRSEKVKHKVFVMESQLQKQEWRFGCGFNNEIEVVVIIITTY